VSAQQRIPHQQDSQGKALKRSSSMGMGFSTL